MTKNDKFILNDQGEVIPEPDLLRWARWFETAREERIVKQTTTKDGIWVSTVFLGLDHSFGGGAPVLWETMAFGDPEEKEFGGEKIMIRPEVDSARSSSRLEALVIHEHMVVKFGGEKVEDN